MTQVGPQNPRVPTSTVPPNRGPQTLEFGVLEES